MVKVKICGITTEEDVLYLNESDVDFAGFVQFYGKSKRNLSTEQAIRLMQGLKPSIQKVAVVVNPDREQMQILGQAGFDYIQIHGEISDELLDESPLPVWKAFNVSDLSEWERYEKHEKVKGFVFDAQVPGSGKVFDWKLLTDLPETEKFVMLAGGLQPENVGEAIRFVQPDGVDTSSGVEKDSGEGKNMEKIQAFVKAVKSGKWMLFLVAVMAALFFMPLTVQAHGTSEDTVTKGMLQEKPPASYQINAGMQKEAEEGAYERFFPDDALQTVKIDIDEKNLNYLLQNADLKPYVMTNKVTIGGESIGYAGLKTKGSYTLEHTFLDYMGNDRFSFTVHFGKYIKKEQYGENQNFYGCKRISFNNFFFDKSMMREFFSMKLMKEMGLPTPQFGLAKLYINDNYYGIYFMVEALDQELLSNHFGRKEKEISDYITKPENTSLAYDKRLDRFCDQAGNIDLQTMLKMDDKGIYHVSGILKDSSYLWEEDDDTLQDVAQMLPTVLSWQRKLNLLSEGKDFEGNALDVNNEEYLKVLAQIIDVDEVVRYFAVHSFLVQIDNMFVEQHNYGLYVDTDGKGMLLPWDYDLSFGCYYPSTAEETANFDLDMMYKGGDAMPADEVYSRYPLFHVIYQNTALMEKYHSYMQDCSKIAVLGGKTSVGKSYEPAWFNHYIMAFQPLLKEAGYEKLAENVSYLNHTSQPGDMLRALPNLAKIIAMRSVGVLSQTEQWDIRVSGSGCDLSTLGNAVPGENSRGGKLAAVDAATGIFVTADYGQDDWSNLSPELTVKQVSAEEKVYQDILDQTGCEESELVVYAMSDCAEPEGKYRVYLPLDSSYRGKEVVLYSCDGESRVEKLEASAEDMLYSAETDSISYIAVAGRGKGPGIGKNTLYYIIGGGLILVLLLLAVLFWARNKRGGKK